MVRIARHSVDGPVAVARCEVVYPHFKRRFTGVTTTVVNLIPALQARGLHVASLGPGLPQGIASLRFVDLFRLWRNPAGRPVRIWHARRNTEMIGGLLLQRVCRMPLALLFTSAAQRNHKRTTKWLIRRMDRVVATSAKAASYLEVPSTVINHGIDLNRFKPSTGNAKGAVGLNPAKKYVGTFARIRPQKGTDLFVEAVIPVLRDHPDWSAIIIGRAKPEHTAYLADLRGMVVEAGLGERVSFLPEQPDLVPWYHAIDLFVAPQRWEGFGLTPLEAMACGVPVVATDTGVFSDVIVEGKTGAVVGRPDSSLLEAAVREFVSNPRFLHAASRSAFEHAQRNFAVAKEAEALHRVYDEMWNVIE